MAALPDHTPDLVKFTTFLRNVVGIDVRLLPDSSPIIQHAFDESRSIVNLDLGVLAAYPMSWSPYELAVYNLGAHFVIEFAPDVSFGLAAMSWTAGKVTATTTSPHAILPGDSVRLTSVSPLGYAGVGGSSLLVTDVPDDTHFGYSVAANPGAAVMLPGASVSEQFFANIRRSFKINSFTPGVVTSTSDLSTSVGLNNPAWAQNLTLENLDLLKTPYGRRYLALAQKYGPTIWGIS